MFRDLAPSEEEIKATLEPSGRRGLVVCLLLQIASEAQGLPSGARPRNPTPTQAGVGAEPGVPAVCASRSWSVQKLMEPPVSQAQRWALDVVGDLGPDFTFQAVVRQ